MHCSREAYYRYLKTIATAASKVPVYFSTTFIFKSESLKIYSNLRFKGVLFFQFTYSPCYQQRDKKDGDNF